MERRWKQVAAFLVDAASSKSLHPSQAPLIEVIRENPRSAERLLLFSTELKISENKSQLKFLEASPTSIRMNSEVINTRPPHVEFA
jgi:hypothetical protein